MSAVRVRAANLEESAAIASMCKSTIQTQLAGEHSQKELETLLCMYGTAKFEEFIAAESSYVAVATCCDSGAVVGTATLSSTSSHDELRDGPSAAHHNAAAPTAKSPVVGSHKLWVRRMVVDASWQRRAIGTQLMEHLQQRAVATMDAVEFNLHAEPSAEPFYHRMGFVTAAVCQSFGGNASLMVKRVERSCS